MNPSGPGGLKWSKTTILHTGGPGGPEWAPQEGRPTTRPTAEPEAHAGDPTEIQPTRVPDLNALARWESSKRALPGDGTREYWRKQRELRSRARGADPEHDHRRRLPLGKPEATR